MGGDGMTCDGCGEPVTDGLARTIRLTVDRTEVDRQRRCPECFAEWIDRYQTEMQPDVDGTDDEIIVD